MTRTTLYTLLSLLTFVLFASCEEETETQEDVAADIAETEEIEDLTPPPIEDYNFKFTELIVTQIPNNLEIIFNTLIDMDMRSNTLIIILSLVEWNEDGTLPTCQVAGGGGIHNPDTDVYSWDPASIPAYLDGSLDGNTLTTDEPIRLNFPVHVDEDIFIVPLSEVMLETVISSDGSELLSGTLDGVIKEADADGIIVKLPTGSFKPFAELIGGSATLDTDTDNDGTNDAWKLKGDFKAIRINFE